jgi:hypothetical protein
MPGEVAALGWKIPVFRAEREGADGARSRAVRNTTTFQSAREASQMTISRAGRNIGRFHVPRTTHPSRGLPGTASFDTLRVRVSARPGRHSA